MLVALTGTPGTGKSSVSDVLREKGFEIVDLNKVAVEKNFFTGIDKKRDTRIVDIDRLNKYVRDNYKRKQIVFFEGHLSHLLKSMDKVIVLRCHPKVLKKRLAGKGWKEEKIRENIEAETLDVILCETAELYSEKNVFEIDTTSNSVDSTASSILKIIKNEFKPMKKYNIGMVDWSEEILEGL